MVFAQGLRGKTRNLTAGKRKGRDSRVEIGEPAKAPKGRNVQDSSEHDQQTVWGMSRYGNLKSGREGQVLCDKDLVIIIFMYQVDQAIVFDIQSNTNLCVPGKAFC